MKERKVKWSFRSVAFWFANSHKQEESLETVKTKQKTNKPEATNRMLFKSANWKWNTLLDTVTLPSTIEVKDAIKLD